MTLKGTYHEIMDQITVTEDMRRRVLASIRLSASCAAKRGSRTGSHRRYWTAAACAAILLVSAALLPRYLHTQQTAPPGSVETIPHFTEVSSREELERAVGFEIGELSGLPFSVTDVTYTVLGEAAAEVRYQGETETAVFRKAAGTDDPSGDYTQYGDIRQVAAADTTVTLKGDDGLYSLALWQADGCACSVRLSTPQAEETWLRILESIC